MKEDDESLSLLFKPKIASNLTPSFTLSNDLPTPIRFNVRMSILQLRALSSTTKTVKFSNRLLVTSVGLHAASFCGVTILERIDDDCFLLKGSTVACFRPEMSDLGFCFATKRVSTELSIFSSSSDPDAEKHASPPVLERLDITAILAGLPFFVANMD